MAKILEGRTLSQNLMETLAEKVKSFEVSPTLVIFQVGDNKASNLYIEKKKEFGSKIGVNVKHIKLPENVSLGDFEKQIERENNDPDVHGVIVQLPLPANFDSDRLVEKINPKKDVDGLTGENVKKLLTNDKDAIVPATARGVISLIDFYGIPLEGKNVVVIGRSALVGKPVAMSFVNRNSTVTICHRKTQNLKEITKRAQILVTAMGSPQFIDKEFVSEGQTIIDIGINTVSGSKMEEEVNVAKKVVGDVKFEEVKDIVEAITPVPGGIGPLTVASLFQNLLDCYQKLRK